MSKMPINEELLDMVNGGSLGFDPEPSGTFTMRCEYSGASYEGVALGDAIQIARYGASIPNTPEGEQQIVQWARDNNIIH